MLTATLKTEDHDLCIIGLVEENLAQLTNGAPILAGHMRGHLLPEGIVILIVYGKTSAELILELDKLKLFDQDTQIIDKTRRPTS